MKKTILITGAGGTVGQLLTKFYIEKGFVVCAIDRSENAIAQLLDLQNTHSCGSNISIEFGDVLDKPFLSSVLEQNNCMNIIHCAALKHVSVGVAFPEKMNTENFQSFKNILDIVATRHDIQKIILCSSDKAANPITVMGASKKTLELLGQKTKIPGTDIVSVRFGNILYSNGSILQKLEMCIQNNEKFVLRDIEMTRYIFTKDDVVSLINYALNTGVQGDILTIQTPSITIEDLIQEYAKKRDIQIPVAYGSNFLNEAIHESLFNEEEVISVVKNDTFLKYNKGTEGNLSSVDIAHVLSSKNSLDVAAVKKIYE